MATISLTPENQRGEHRFFSVMAAAIVVTALAGFSRTYFLRSFLPALVPPPLALTPLIHLHGLLFTGWVLLLLAQARLLAEKRIPRHRQLGVAGGVMAGLMVLVGTLTALYGVVRGVAPFGIDARRFLIVPLFAILLFAIFVVAGVRARRDAQSHKRWMLLATFALLPPAIARWVLLLGLGALLRQAVRKHLFRDNVSLQFNERFTGGELGGQETSAERQFGCKSRRKKINNESTMSQSSG